MASSGGWACILKAAGTATALTNEVCSDLGSDVWQITDATKRVLDPDTAITVTDDDGAVSASEYTIDYLFGKVTFSVAPNTNVDITGKYLPMWEITNAHAAGLSLSADILDVTEYNNTHVAREKKSGLKASTANVSVHDFGTDDYDTGGTEIKFFDMLDTDSNTQFVFELQITSTSIFRGWGRFESEDIDPPVEGVLSATFNWVSSEYKGSQAFVSYGFSDE